MKSLHWLVLTVFLWVLSVPSIAGEWSAQEFINQITVWDDKTVLVRNTNGVWPNPDLCTRDDAIVLLPPDAEQGAPAYDEIYAALLAAYTTDNRIVAYISGCVAIGNSSFPLFTQFSTVKN